MTTASLRTARLAGALSAEQLVERPFELVEPIVRTKPAELIARAFVRRGVRPDPRQLEARVHPRRHGSGVGVIVDLESSLGSAATAAIRLRWHAKRLRALVPGLDAELSVAPASATTSRLTIDGVYRPPFKLAGVVWDALVGRRVARRCAQQFLADLAEELELGDLDPLG